MASEIHLPETGCASDVTALCREEVSAQRACHSSAVLQTKPRSSYCFSMFLGWHCNSFTHLFVPITVLFVLCVHLRPRSWVSAVRCIYPNWTSHPALPDSSGLACFHVAARLPALLMTHLDQLARSRERREEGQRTLSLIPALSKLLWSFRKAIRASHQFLYQQKEEEPWCCGV